MDKAAIVGKYKAVFADKAFVKSLAVGFAVLVGSLVINYFAALYALDRASNPVTDIILSNFPAVDVDGIFVFGPIIFWSIACLIVLYDPRKAPFFLKSVALFVIIRSAFISMTHIGPYPGEPTFDAAGTWFMHIFSANSNFFIFSSGADLFFSGHTGLPFLLALMFWKEKPVRYFCLASSIFFAIVVLMGHYHYSIDVASAFFITYTINHIAVKMFQGDWRLFRQSYAQFAANAKAGTVV